MATVSLRRAVPGDKPALLALENSCFDTDRLNARQMHYLLHRGKSDIRVVDMDGVMVAAIISLLPARPRPARLYSLAVMPSYRNKGLAAMLLGEALGVMRQQGYQRCRLEVRQSQQAVIRLYTSFGFTPLTTLHSYYQDGEDALRMELNLDNAGYRGA